MNKHRRTGPGRGRRPAPAGPDLYAYTSTYGRPRHGHPGLTGWRRTAGMLLTALAILLAFAAACAYVVERSFPSPAGAYWLAGLAMTAFAALLALVLWARRG